MTPHTANSLLSCKSFFLIQDIRRQVLLFLHPSESKPLIFSCTKWARILLEDDWFWRENLMRYFAMRHVNTRDDSPTTTTLKKEGASSDELSIDSSAFAVDSLSPNFHRKLFNSEISRTKCFVVGLEHRFQPGDWFTTERVTHDQLPVTIEKFHGCREPFLSAPIEFESPEEIGQVLTLVYHTNSALLEQIGEKEYEENVRAAFLATISLFYSLPRIHLLFARMLQQIGISALQIEQLLRCDKTRTNMRHSEHFDKVVQYVNLFHSLSDSIHQAWKDMSRETNFRVIGDVKCKLSDSKREITVKLSILNSIAERHPFEFFYSEMRGRRIFERDMDHPDVDTACKQQGPSSQHMTEHLSSTASKFLRTMSKHCFTSTGCISMVMMSYIRIADLCSMSPQLFQFLCILLPSVRSAFVSNYDETEQVGVNFGEGKKSFPLFAWINTMLDGDELTGEDEGESNSVPVDTHHTCSTQSQSFNAPDGSSTTSSL
eukprot:CAMPEP_0117435246 /NCGR_PEP_ID=MMETSP0759-20121206/379_1 /TAXON_ID=63605 /ORGANISM="Percolomonas cosmopolitus, Strain WS" /LENGTH=487 /DNA_ID=CAMNT_0005226781 /DNA_START=37 /DNA_END=1500 /DNA_ORIENTATION=+